MQWAAWIFYLVLRDVGLPVIIIEGRRDEHRQHQLLEAGRTQTLESKHLEGLAFDFAWAKRGYNVPDYYWYVAGAVGEWLGLVWGGRWRSLRDLGHLEAPSRDYVLPKHLFTGSGSAAGA